MERETTSLRFREINMSYSDEVQAMPQDHVTQIDFAKELSYADSASWSITERRKIYVAALNNNWQGAKVLLEKDPTLLYSKLTLGQDTALHIATGAKCSAFIKELINFGKVDPTFSIDYLTLRNKNEDTALSIAAASGFMDIARIMIKQDNKLPNLINKDRETPLLKAVQSGHKKMARYLFPLTHIDVHEDRIRLFVAMVMSEMYDISLVMLRKHPLLAYDRDKKSKLTALDVLAQKCQDTTSGSRARTTIRYIYSWICGKASKPTFAYQLLEKIWDQVLHDLEDEEILKLIRATPSVLFEAIKSGNVEFVRLLLKNFPDLIWEVDENGEQLFDAAISHKNEKIFKLIYKLGGFRDTNHITHIDDDGNNMLHLVGKSAPLEKLDISPPNLQMQQELSWFEEVKKIMPPAFINMKNKEGKTPEDVFLKEHSGLISEARTAMKETASQCMVVSTIICSIVFAAALIVPGSSNRSPQTPIFHRDIWFLIFVLSNAVALFSSALSTILLQSILTSIFMESDYTTSLRKRMWWALKGIFISIFSMGIAFTAAVFLIFDYQSIWLPYLTASFALVPAVVYYIFVYLKVGMRGRI